jgi:hypothetical protein
MIINLQNAANNLLDALTDYNDIMKSWNPRVNAPERVETQKKTHSGPFYKEEGEGRNY